MQSIQLRTSHDCKVHLCASVPCGQPDDDCVHVPATAVIPRASELDLQDVAGKGPLGRCATAARFWLLECCWMRLFRSTCQENQELHRVLGLLPMLLFQKEASQVLKWRRE